MSTNHTANYDLCQWEATDQVLRTDFNQDNAKIDAALAAKAEQSEFSALSADVQQIQADLTKITIGSYTGNGNVTRSFNLGVYPQAVLIMCSYGATGYHYSRFMHLGGLALRGKPAKTREGDAYISVTSNGFSVSDEGHDNGCSVLLNYSEYVYYYIVFS